MITFVQVVCVVGWFVLFSAFFATFIKSLYEDDSKMVATSAFLSVFWTLACLIVMVVLSSLLRWAGW